MCNSRGPTLLMALASCAILGVTLSVPARAFRCSVAVQNGGPSLYWEQGSVPMLTSDRGTGGLGLGDLSEAVQYSAAQWNGVTCADVELSTASTSEPRTARYDWLDASSNGNVIAVRSGTDSDATDAWLHPVNALALTTLTFVATTGQILDADIELNDVFFDFTDCDTEDDQCTTGYDLRNTMTHELGHVLGLDHPPTDQPGALQTSMYARAPEGDLQKRDLAPDDEAGLCFIYPTGADRQNCTAVERVEPQDIRVEEVGGCGTSAISPFWFGFSGLIFLTRRRNMLRKQ